ncbi:GTPase-activating protein CdGAPr isoform X3 [Rhodnius prolixus]|uniref:GTPase-activating protein CdGAPr isoform X3 n=1 Tax=Rhodnius prolixus TaxID=13249 RepID=UPI003D1893FE
MASVSGTHTSRTLLDIIPPYSKSKIEVGSVRLKSLVGVSSVQNTTSRFPKLEECAHFHYEHVDLQPIQLSIIEEEPTPRGEFDGVTLKVTSGSDSWQIRRTYAHFCKLDQQLHQCVFDRKFSHLPILSNQSPKTHGEANVLLNSYVRRLSAIGSGCAISCGPALSWFELDNRGRRLVAAGHGINTPAVAAAFATTPYTAHATDELSFQIGDMISVIDMPPAEESSWWRGKRGFVVGFFPSNCVAVITDKIPNEIALAEPSKPVLRKHGKLIAFFRAFILSRPSRRRLKQTGILKERVFGCDLSEHLLNSGREIPLVLKCCSEFIEAHGIVDGIYRLSGVTSNIQRLRSIFDEDRVPVLSEDSGIKQDIHGVASLLKMYFRELPNPLCTYQLYDEFVAAVQSPSEKRLENMRRVVQKLPPPHYRTLEYLMGHLGRVCGHSTGTGMTARNVAIVWAPNLLRCRSLDQGVAALQGVGVQAVVTEFLILNSPLIFNTQSSDSVHSRPKSLAVCSPTKLLTLQEAQARGQQSPTQASINDSSSDQVINQPCYHTVIDLPRKRQPLNWRTIFTPRRSHQTKSPRRFKRKTVVKSAEFLGIGPSNSSCPVQTSGPSTSTHSRSVSHDSYFDTTIDQPSTSSLVETQHEGLSLSLDLSELQMNFDIEESEMRIFSEDETNQLFSSGASIVFGALDTESNLEQRFSNQELRANNGVNTLVESTASSRKSEDVSPYAYEKLAESPNNNVPDNLQQKKENDLYESCSGDIVIQQENIIYESMETEPESYEPILGSSLCNKEKTYENEDVAKELKEHQTSEQNIYEDVQLTPSEIYEQVSYLRSSVEEVNRMISEQELPSSKPTDNTKKHEECSVNKRDTSVYESSKMDEERFPVEVYEEIRPLLVKIPENSDSINLRDDSTTETSLEDSKIIEIENVACSSTTSTNDTQEEESCQLNNSVHLNKVQIRECTNVPDGGVMLNSENIYDSVRGTEYENVSFVLNKNGNTIVSNSENSCKELKVDEDYGNLVNVKKEPNFNKILCDNNFSDSINIECNEPTDRSNLEILNETTKRQSESNDNSRLEAEDRHVSSKHSCNVVSEVLKRDWVGRCKDASQMSLPLNKFEDDNDFGKTEKLRKMFEKDTIVNVSSKDTKTKTSPNLRHEGINQKEEISPKLISEEPDLERRERIEKYKEERRMFFRNKYKTDNLNNNDERDEELIRRIKQKTKLKEFRESDVADVAVPYRRRSVVDMNDTKKSPTKTTVSISYSPTKVKALDIEQLTAEEEEQKNDDKDSSSQKKSK